MLVADGCVAVKYYPDSRPVYCEEEAVQRILTFAEATKTALHIHHVSSGVGARLIREAQRKGIDVTGETCPQYLLFSDEVYQAQGLPSTYLVIAPPLRKAGDQEKLWKALSAGDLSMVATITAPTLWRRNRLGSIILPRFRRVRWCGDPLAFVIH